jgi:hypothetical protein
LFVLSVYAGWGGGCLTGVGFGRGKK